MAISVNAIMTQFANIAVTIVELWHYFPDVNDFAISH